MHIITVRAKIIINQTINSFSVMKGKERKEKLNPCFHLCIVPQKLLLKRVLQNNYVLYFLMGKQAYIKGANQRVAAHPVHGRYTKDIKTTCCKIIFKILKI